MSPEEDFCEIILKFLKSGHWPKGRSRLNVFSCYFKLCRPFCSAERNDFSNFGKESSEEHFCEIILKLEHWPRRRCRLKVSYCQLWRPFCSAERNGFNNFGRGLPKEQWPSRRCRLTVISFLALATI